MLPNAGDLHLKTSGSALTGALKHGISLLKPSLSELESIVGEEVRSPPAQMVQAKHLVEFGASEMVALTLGAAGAILATAVRVIYSPAFAVSEKTGVGAGQVTRRLGLRSRRAAHR